MLSKRYFFFIPKFFIFSISQRNLKLKFFYKKKFIKTEISAIHKIETFLAIFIGALTFTGSVVAWGKLDGKIGSEPLLLCGKFRHWLNALNIGVCCFLAYGFIISSNQMYLIIMCGLSGFLGWA